MINLGNSKDWRHTTNTIVGIINIKAAYVKIDGRKLFKKTLE